MEPGETLDGRYRLEREVGSGGVGTVYKARDTRSGSTVAVKILHRPLTKDPDYARRFHRGARIARSLRSPHLLQVFDDGQDGDTHYLVMEFVDGKTLADLLNERRKLSERQAHSILQQAALALQAAHRRGVVHRDISPGNILIDQRGAIKVTDFDIAKAQGATRMTSTGMFMGKVRYSAPEAFGGKTDIRSDLYSLGVMLYEMLSGQVPFDGDTPLAVMEQHRTMVPPQLDELAALGDGLLGRILRRLLAKRPEDRIQTPDALLDELAGRPADATRVMAASSGEAAGGAPPPPRRTGSRLPGGFSGRRQAYGLVIAGAISSALVAILVGILLVSGGDSGSATVVRETETPAPTTVAMTQTAGSTATLSAGVTETAFRPTVTRTPIVPPPPPPPPVVVSLGCSPGGAQTDETIACNPTINGTVTSYQWLAPGGTPTSGNGSSFPTRYSSAGSKTVTLTAFNSGGCDTENQSITVTPPQPPIINSLGCSPTNIQTGQTVTCNPIINGAVNSYQWSAPGGAPSSGSGNSFSTSYGTTGTMTITVTACNSGGCDTESQAITVIPQPPTPTFTISPSNGPVGACVKASGSGFRANTSVSYSANGIVLATVVTDSSGSFNTAGTVPTIAFPGTFQVTATDGQRTAPPFSFTVTAGTGSGCP